MKFLITNPDSFGDIVLRQPLFTGLLDAGHEVGVLVKRSYSQIIHFLDPRLRVCMTGDVNPYGPGIYKDREKVELGLIQAEEFGPDVVVIAPYQRTQIDLWTQERFATKRTVGMKGIEIVYDTGMGVFRPVTTPGDVVLQVPEDLREIEKNRRLLALCLGTEVREYHPTFRLPAATLELARAKLKQLQLIPGEFIICTPSSTSLALKQYPIERFIEILSHWSKTYDHQVLLVGNQVEEPTLRTIQFQLRSRNVFAAVWIGDDTNLETLLGMTALSKLYFGNDTGPMHFAAALEKPVVAIFGGGTWPRFIPDAKEGAALLQELPCFGCRWKCLFEKALCIQAIDERRVMNAVDDFEAGNLKPFKILADTFEGEMTTTWIQEAKSKLKDYRGQVESVRVEHERESTSLNRALHVRDLEIESLRVQVTENQESLSRLKDELNAKSQRLEEEKSASAKLANQVKVNEEKIRLVQMQLSQQTDQFRKERDTNMQLQAHLKQSEDNGRALQAYLEKQNEQIRLLAIQLKGTQEDLAQKEHVISRSIEFLQEIKPKLEEVHLETKLQEESMRELEESLDGLMQSGWIRLGIRIGVPWLKRWHTMVFQSEELNGRIPASRAHIGELIALKEHLRGRVDQVTSILKSQR